MTNSLTDLLRKRSSPESLDKADVLERLFKYASNQV